jgi:hypothetical protein
MFGAIKVRVLPPNISRLLNHPLCETLMSFSPLAFEHTVCYGRDNCKAVRGVDVLKFCSALCLQNLLCFDFGEKIKDFRLRCGRLSHNKKIKFISEEF